MKQFGKLMLIVGVMALSAAPALAAQPSDTPPTHPSHPAHPTQAKSFGFYCQNESKKHVDGQKGTPFSQCVHAMAQLANGSTDNPSKACAGESKKHVEGEKGTPFSRCVSAAAKLQHDQDQSSESTD
jgi:hypothetical protein